VGNETSFTLKTHKYRRHRENINRHCNLAPGNCAPLVFRDHHCACGSSSVYFPA